jgi:hypothetical protein
MRAFVVILLGAVSGAVSTAFLGPKAIAYWIRSPVPIPYDCTPAVEKALSWLNWMQLSFTLIGALVFLVIDRVVLRKKTVPAPST